MARDCIKKVVNEYARYERLKQLPKTCATTDVYLTAKSNHNGYETGETELIFPRQEETGRLNIEVKASHSKTFKFKFFCDDFMDPPCYRFDSDGHEHRIDDPKGLLTLEERKVSTPHFHRFNEQGVEIPYKTQELREYEQKYLRDYNEALRHFCQEENIHSETPLALHVETLPLRPYEYDNPLEGLPFK